LYSRKVVTDIGRNIANRTLALKETTDSTKHPKKNENYNEILEKPFIFNLQTVSTSYQCWQEYCHAACSLQLTNGDKLYKEGGITPKERLLLSKLRNCRPASFPRLSGIGPRSQFSLRDTALSDDRLASDAGISPMKVCSWARVLARIWPLS
jgi:hypothetical protein